MARGPRPVGLIFTAVATIGAGLFLTILGNLLTPEADRAVKLYAIAGFPPLPTLCVIAVCSYAAFWFGKSRAARVVDDGITIDVAEITTQSLKIVGANAKAVIEAAKSDKQLWGQALQRAKREELAGWEHFAAEVQEASKTADERGRLLQEVRVSEALQDVSHRAISRLAKEARAGAFDTVSSAVSGYVKAGGNQYAFGRDFMAGVKDEPPPRTGRGTSAHLSGRLFIWQIKAAAVLHYISEVPARIRALQKHDPNLEPKQLVQRASEGLDLEDIVGQVLLTAAEEAGIAEPKKNEPKRADGPNGALEPTE